MKGITLTPAKEHMLIKVTHKIPYPQTTNIKEIQSFLIIRKKVRIICQDFLVLKSLHTYYYD